MTYTRNSPIRGTSTVSEQQLYDAFAPMTPPSQLANLRKVCHQITTDSAATGVDPLVVSSIGWIETGAPGTGLPFRSSWWVNGFNFGNLGITGDKQQNAAAQTWSTPGDGVRATVAHLVGYSSGKNWRSVWDTDELGDPTVIDKRFNLAIANTPNSGGVKTLADLNNRWAVDIDNDYGGKLAERANKLAAAIKDPPVTIPPNENPEPIPGEQEPPMATYNYDNGVRPPAVDIKVTEGNKYAGYINPADHFIAGFVIHSAYGSLEGSTQWFQGGNALTDLMVGNSFDGAALDGQVRRFNDAYGPRYSWSSGPVSSPIDDAAKFLEIFGPNPEVVNMYTTAMERSCGSNVATNEVTEKEHKARCAWIAYHANIYGKYLFEKTGKHQFTCDTFPLIPSQNNRSFIIYHGEINADKRTSCPDAFVRADIDREIADIRALMAKWQKGTDTIPPQVPPEQLPTYAPVKVIDQLQAYKDKDAAPSYVTVGSDRFIFVNDRVRARKATPRYQTANVDGLKIGPDIEKGLEFAVLWMFWDEKGVPWMLTPYWTRVLADDTERIADAA